MLIGGNAHFEAFFEVLPPSTNSLIHYLGIPLVLLFDARVAEKIIISALIVGGTLALRCCARAMGAPNAWVCAFAAPATYTLTLYTGNYNFLLSFLLFFLILRRILLDAERFGVASGLRLAVLFLLAALAHPIGAIFAAVGSGVLVLWSAWLRTSAASGRARLLGIVRHCWVPALAAIPAMLLMGLYLWSHYTDGAEFGPGVHFGPGLVARLKSFVGLRQLYTVDNWQIFVCLAAALALQLLTGAALLARIRMLQLKPRLDLCDGLLLVAAVALALYLVIPDGGAGAGYIVGRLDLIPWLVLLIWVATRPFGRIERGAALVLVGPIALALLATNAIAIAKVQPALAALAAGEALLAQGSTVLPIIAKEKPIYAFPEQGYLQNNPFQHTQHYAAADRGIVMLSNWNAHYWGFPIHFRARTDPYRFFDPVGLRDMDLERYETETGQSIDAVIVLGATPDDLARDHAPLFTTLTRLYCPCSVPASVGSLFVHHAADGSCRPASTSRTPVQYETTN
jgi:hypothetical protein